MSSRGHNSDSEDEDDEPANWIGQARRQREAEKELESDSESDDEATKAAWKEEAKRIAKLQWKKKKATAAAAGKEVEEALVETSDDDDDIIKQARRLKLAHLKERKVSGHGSDSEDEDDDLAKWLEQARRLKLAKQLEKKRGSGESDADDESDDEATKALKPSGSAKRLFRNRKVLSSSSSAVSTHSPWPTRWQRHSANAWCLCPIM